MKHLLLLSLVMLLSAISVFAQDRQLTREKPAEEQRVALIIGNAAYETSPLKNPVNDARAIAQTLKALGFQVILKENINQVEMKRAVREFGDKIKNGGIGLFYFAGHGVQVKGQNYLVPIGATITKEEEVEYEGLDVGFVMAQMEAAKNRMNIVILDACRNNPFARSYRSESNGLASISAPSGTLIAYATAPGSVASDGDGANGLYTQELLFNLRTVGLNIEEVFKRVRISVRQKTQNNQTPWESSSLTGDFYFVKPGDVKTNAANQQIQISTVDSTAIELAYWNSIKDSKDPEDYKAYIEKYPNGQFASLALKRSQAKSKNSEYIEFLNQAEEAIQRNNIDNAIENLKKAIQIDDSKPGPYEQLGLLYFERKEYIAAQEAMISAINKGGKVLFDRVFNSSRSTSARGAFNPGKLLVTKNGIILKFGLGEKAKTYEVDFADVTIERQGELVFIKLRDGLNKIIKGSKDDTKIFLYMYEDSKEKAILLFALLTSGSR